MSLTARPTESLDVSALRALDRATRYGPIALRVVGYTLLLHASPEQSMLSALIAGVFLGDTIAWLPRAWFDVRFHGLAVAIEAVVYSVLFFSMQASGALALPVDIGARYLTGGAAALVVGLQGASFSWKLSR